MPSKKTHAPARSAGELTEEISERHEAVLETEEIDLSSPKEDRSVLCGHINRHSHGLDRKLDNIACDLLKGHGGDHEGEHEEYSKEYDTRIENGIEITRMILVPHKRRVQWGDMAGIPVKDIPRPRQPEPPTVANLEKRLRALEAQSIGPDGFINR